LLPKQPTTFGIAARFHPQKDHETFFRAAAEVLKTHPGARFVAAGKGLTAKNPGVAALVGAARVPSEALDLRDEVANMAEFYQSIDALCLSSRTEGFPNVIAEAMSHGRPAVTTDVGDAAAIVADAGFVAPPKDPMALAAAMRRILDLDPEAYASLARRARSRIETHYSLDRVAAHYAAFLNADRPEAIGAASRARS
jgi:glycosyltransferase involved in cell wall biosynthesis